MPSTALDKTCSQSAIPYYCITFSKQVQTCLEKGGEMLLISYIKQVWACFSLVCVAKVLRVLLFLKLI